MLLSRLASIRLTHPAPARLGRWTYTTSGGISVFTKGVHAEKDVTDELDNELTGGPTFTWARESDVASLLVASTLSVGLTESCRSHT